MPCVGGVGEVTRAVSKGKKAVDAVDDVHDAAKAAVNIGDAAKAFDNAGDVVKKVHGNSLKSIKTNYGYALLDKDNNIMKFGETINPKTRYSQKYLNQNGYSMVILESGSKTDVHFWQYDMNMYYKSRYGSLPPLNKRGW